MEQQVEAAQRGIGTDQVEAVDRRVVDQPFGLDVFGEDLLGLLLGLAVREQEAARGLRVQIP